MSSLSTALDQAAAEGVEASAKRWCRFIDWRPGTWLEVQALGVTGGGAPSLYAHAESSDALVRLLEEIETEPGVTAQAIYVVMNPVRPEMVAAREDSGRTLAGQWWAQERGQSTTDRDIVCRSALYVDVDADRARGTSATAEELALAQGAAAAIYQDLTAMISDVLGQDPTTTNGYNAVAIGGSGNGCSLFVAIDHLEETLELRALVNDTLAAVKAIYTCPGVKIDAQVTDPKRLVPAFGTTKKKGPADDSLRPHRRTALLAPDPVRRLSLAELQRLHDALRARAPAPARPLFVASPAPPPSTGGEVAQESGGEEGAGTDLASLRKRLVHRRGQKAASTLPEDAEHYRVLTAVLEGAPIAKAHGDPGRSWSVNLAATLLRWYFPLEAPWEAAAEVLRPCLVATVARDLAAGERGEEATVAHWLGVAQASYERAEGRYAEHLQVKAVMVATREETRAAIRTAAAAGRLCTVSLEASAPPPSGSSQGSAIADAFALSTTPADWAPPPPVEDPDAWMRQLITRADNKILPCGENIRVFLDGSAETKGTIRFNDVTKEIEVRGGQFDGVRQDVLDTAIVDHLQRHYHLAVQKGDVQDRLLRVAYDHAYDPIQDYLRRVEVVWDGVPRLDRFFLGESYTATDKDGSEVVVPAHVTARRTGASGQDLIPYLRLVASKFFLSCVARALKPGEQVDNMLVLEGLREGEGKSSLVRILAGEWYIETRLALGDKDSQMIPAGNWLVELGELSSVNRSEAEALKSYLTTRVDKFRPPYGRVYEKYPRRCVFVGTTNKEHWLTPERGERRYWPVYMLAVDLEAVERDRDQLWAEAVVRYRAGEKWHLIGADDELARAQARQRVALTMIDALVEEWWYGLGDEKRAAVQFISTLDLAKKALKLGDDALLKLPKGTEAGVEAAMRRLGFEPGKVGRLPGWVQGAALREVTEAARKVAPVSYLHVVPGMARPEAKERSGGSHGT